MNKNTFISNLTIKDTILDRRYKLTKSQIEEITIRYTLEDSSISELSKEYGVSWSRIKTIIDPAANFKKAASKRAWYYSLTPTERNEKSKQWNNSTKEYKARIYKAFIENI